MHYLVDAYNLLFCALKKGKSLEARRQQVIKEINAAASVLNLRITLVFDGAGEVLSYPRRGHFDQIELVYTLKNTTADEYILDEVMAAKTPCQITVVTNDRPLAARCKDHRACTQSIDAFLSFLSQRKSKKKKRSQGSEREFQESSSEFMRLLAIFEKKLNEEL